MTQEKPPPREILSPEGVEERVMEEFVFRITLTGGGKYRVYAQRYITDTKPTSIGVRDDKRAAQQLLAKMVMGTGLMLEDPKALIDVLNRIKPT